MRIAAAVFALIVFTGGTNVAAADNTDCIKAYERAVAPYWSIANDILTFKSMFDDYDRICTRHAPEVIESLQPRADKLRAQTDADIVNAQKVIRHAFAETLPGRVGEDCRDDSAARQQVEKNVLSAMAARSNNVNARLERSAAGLGDQVPDITLRLCRDLPKLAPQVERVLGPDLKNPLLEMSALHARTVTRDTRQRREALSLWRTISGAADAPQP